MKRHEDGRQDGDEGSATAEFALVLPVVVMLAALLLYMARASVVRMECQDAAATAARALVVKGDEADVASIVSNTAGAASSVAVSGDVDATFTVTVACPVIADPLGVLPMTVEGSATGVAQ